MGAYLNQDSGLLPPDVREESDVVLEEKIVEVEADILDKYRVWDTDSYEVLLYGYDSGDPAAVKTQFASDMEATVAKVVTHRMRNLDHQGDVKSWSEGRRSRTYRDHTDPLWPNGWDERLVKHDLRTRAHVV